jgi:hypothetical protein
MVALTDSDIEHFDMFHVQLPPMYAGTFDPCVRQKNGCTAAEICTRACVSLAAARFRADRLFVPVRPSVP